jgi:hypothetical protein
MIKTEMLFEANGYQVMMIVLTELRMNIYMIRIEIKYEVKHLIIKKQIRRKRRRKKKNQHSSVEVR